MYARPLSRRPASSERRGRSAGIGRVAVAALVVAAAVPLAAGPASADPPSTAGRVVLSGGGNLYTMAGDGTDVVQIASGGAMQPTWSPDGSRVAFTRGGDVWTVDADGTGAQQLTHHTAFDGGPSWSPDGLSIAFFSTRTGSGSQLFLMNADGTGETQLTSAPSVTQANFPDWSPDGSAVAFAGSTSLGVGVHVVRADGTGLTRVTTANDSFPSWAPDGSAIAFSRTSGTLRDLFRVSPTGTDLTQLTSTPSLDELRPAYSPDGQKLVYDSAPATNGTRRLVAAAADGSNPVDLSDGSTGRDDGEFSPAGTGGGTVVQPGTGSGSTSAGQTLDLAVTAPVPGSEAPASTDPLQVSGTVSLSTASTRPYNAAYVVDVSGSTGDVWGRDCDGSRTVNSADNFNGDSRTGDILDCEIAAVIALNTAVAGVPSSVAGVVALGGAVTSGQPAAALADMAPDAGEQSATPAGAIVSGQQRGHVETVLRSLREGFVGQYTPKTIGANTDYDAALEKMNAFFLGRPGSSTNVAYFMSDGEPNAGTFDTTLDGPLQMAVYRGVRIFTFAVGTNAGGCATGQPLQVVASRTGGTCTAVSDPALLGAAVSTPAALDRVDVRLDSGTPVTAVVDDTTTPPTWTASIPGGLPAGTHTLTATAHASDGSTVSATSTVTGLAAPVADAGGDYAVDEGSTVALAGTASDADGEGPVVAWSPADRLTGADTLTPTYAGDDDRVETLTLTATDEDGLTGVDTATMTTVNVAPSLGTVALTPQPATGTPFVLAVDFTDPGTFDTHTATVDWGDGTVEDAVVTPGTGGGTVSAEHTYTAGGQVTVTVTVTDDDAGTATTQTGPFRVNTAPTATAGGPYSVTEGTALALAGTAQDPDGDALTIAWSPADRIADPASPTSAYDTTDDADEVLTLTVGDGDLTATAQTQVTVLNAAPTLGALTVPTDVVPPGTPVALSGSYTDPGTADSHTATVDWGDGTVDELALSGGQVAASHTYAAGGTWTVTVTVTDDDGGTASATATMVTNRAPAVDAGADVAVDEGTPASLDATATDPDGDALTLAWTPADAVATATVEDPTVATLDDGTTTLTLTATDPHGAAGSDTVDVVVRNVAPSVDPLTGPTAPVPSGTAVRVSGTFTDPGGADTHTTRVDWGDGTGGDAFVEAGAVTAEHTYADPGTYTVTVTVTDDDGGTGSRTLEGLVVYDRDAVVAGTGTFDSPAGALRADPRANGRATFTVAAAYLPLFGGPVGVTQLELSGRGGFTFRSARVESLVTSGSTGTYQGTGTVNGRTGYGFAVTAVDGTRTTADRVQIRIWALADGAVVYDNGGTALRSGGLLVN
jgi:Tol biopolymer transport system component/PKD repeat protein